MYLLLLTFPLFGFLSVCFFGLYLGTSGSVLVTIFCMVVTALLSFFIFYEIVLSESICIINGSVWVTSDVFDLTWSFLFDSLTAVMLIVVTFVSCLIHIYASEYMSQDPHLPRFMSYLSLFTFFMLILVTGNNFIQLFVGWEGVGLCSYLLINFWYLRLQANKAAMKAMVMNRIGDLGLCLGLFFIYTLTGSLDYSVIFSTVWYWYASSIFVFQSSVDIFSIICLFLFVGSVGKSAQIGLHTWLPDAMEGPTPVSALIHAATMVTAGVFLILRCSILFEMSSTALLVLTFVGAMTAFFAATIGVFQNDLKKIIAYSTCSQLGYMIFVCGVSGYQISLYHLANHAVFKALLFLSAGSIIHAIADEQDMRKMGGLYRILPFSYIMIMIGSFSLMGLPFLTGFYSKDYILELSYSSYTIHGHFAFWLGSLAAFLTSFYSIRLMYLTFLSKTKLNTNIITYAHDAPIRMALPLFILAIPSIFLGYLWRDLFLGGGLILWNQSIFILPSSADLLDAEFISFIIKLIPVLFSVCGGLCSYVIYFLFSSFLFTFKTTRYGILFYSFFNQRWYFDAVYNYFIGLPVINFAGSVSFTLIDKGFIELFGPYGISMLSMSMSNSVSRFHNGWIHHLVAIMLVGVCFFVFVGFGDVILLLKLVPVLCVGLMSFFTL